MRTVHRHRLLLWIGIPLSIMALVELAARRFEARAEAHLNWYQGAMNQMAAGGCDYIFVGTSRTAGGIRTDAWEDEIEKVVHRNVVCLNLGHAYAGPVANAFGLRELVSRYPERMRSCTVFFEMSAGLPALSGGWDGRWFYEGNRQLVADFMRKPDLVRFLRSPQHGFEDKAAILARYLGRRSSLIRTRRQILQAIEWHVMQTVRACLVRLGAAETPSGVADLPINRQLRRDAGGIRLQREVARDRVRPEELEKQTPLTPWGRHVICQSAADLRLHGIHVVYYDVPVPADLWTVNSTPLRMRDRETFDLWAREQGIPELQTGLTFSDEDFPDLSHLRASKVEEYTRALARSWLSSSEGQDALANHTGLEPASPR
jgi:hypothetical protein